MNETEVANFALGRLGIGQTIESIDEATNAARQCKRWFAQCRNEVLRDFAWGFAFKAEALALVSDQEFPGWTYVYQYPQGCAAIRSIADEGGMRYARAAFNWPYAWDSVPELIRFPWQLALKDDGASQVILTDVPDAWAFFTGTVTNLSVWPADAISALASKLASEIGGPLQANAQLIQLATQTYEGLRLRAAANAMNEGRPDQDAEASSIRARA